MAQAQIKVAKSSLQIQSWMQNSHEKCEGFLCGMPLIVAAIFATILSLSLSLFFFSPKFLILTAPVDGTFEWSRGLTFIQQSADPFNLAAVREPAMRWRILPALASKVFCPGIPGGFVIPAIGIIAMCSMTFCIVARATTSRGIALMTTVMLGTTGGMITCTNFVGINDCWYIFSLIVLSFVRSNVIVGICCLLAPWIEERFLIGMPLALAIRSLHLQTNFRDLLYTIFASLPGVVTYLVIRYLVERSMPEVSSTSFLNSMPQIWMASFHYVPAGVGMGFRAAWLLILIPAIGIVLSDRLKGILLLCSSVFASVLVVLLAADYTRSTGILIPLLIFCVIWTSNHLDIPSKCTSILCIACAANWMIPFVWITYNKLWLVMPLPIELIRVVK